MDKNFYRQRGLHVETVQSALTVILKLAIGGLTSVILIVLGTINLQFQGWFVPISRDQFSELWQLMSRLQSRHYIVLLPGGGFNTYKTTHRIWLRILSIALEKELKGP